MGLKYKNPSLNQKLVDLIDEMEEIHKQEIKEYRTLVRRLSNKLERLKKENAQLKIEIKVKH